MLSSEILKDYLWTFPQNNYWIYHSYATSSIFCPGEHLIVHLTVHWLTTVLSVTYVLIVPIFKNFLGKYNLKNYNLDMTLWKYCFSLVVNNCRIHFCHGTLHWMIWDNFFFAYLTVDHLTLPIYLPLELWDVRSTNF